MGVFTPYEIINPLCIKYLQFPPPPPRLFVEQSAIIHYPTINIIQLLD